MRLRFVFRVLGTAFCLLIGILLSSRMLDHPLPGVSAQHADVTPAPAVASVPNTDLPAVEFVSSVGGTVNAVAISDTLAYVGQGAALMIVDVSDPLQPLQLSRLPLPDRVEKITVLHNLAYVANTYSGLQIIDVQDATNPRSLGSFDTPGVAVDVLVADRRAYIADGCEGLHIVDVSDPTTPGHLGTYETAACVSIVQLVGPDIAYLGDGNSGLFVVDLKDPSAPELLNHTYEMSAVDMYVVGDRAYLVGPDVSGLGIFDVSDPVNPVRIGSHSNRVESARRIWVEDDLAYILTYATLQIIDVSDPSEPRELDAMVTGVSPSDLDVRDGLVYVAVWDGEIKIIDAGDPHDLILEGGYVVTLGWTRVAHVVDDIAFVGDDRHGLQVFDVGDPAHPAWLSRDGYPALVYDLEIQDDLAYVAQGERGLQILDVSTPLTPTLVGSYSGGASEVNVRGSLAFLTYGGSLQIVDVSDPINPTRRSTYSGLHSVSVDDDVVYGRDDDGFQIIDVSDPDAPRFLGRYTIPDIYYAKPSRLTVLGDFVYLGLDEGLQIIDVSAPSAPVLLKTDPAFRGNVQLAGDYGFLAGGIGLRRMHVFDTRTPDRPKPRGAYILPAHFRETQLINDVIYVADGDGGLQILRVHPERFPPEWFLPMVASSLQGR